MRVRGRKSPAFAGPESRKLRALRARSQRPGDDNSGQPRVGGLRDGRRGARARGPRRGARSRSTSVAVDRPGAEVLRRLRPAGDAVGQAVARRRALVAGGDVAGQEGVAGADRGDRLERLDLDLVARPAGALPARRPAARRSPSPTIATQPFSRVMIASPAPISIRPLRPRREVVRVVELVAHRPPRPRATFGATTAGSARRPARIGSPSASSTVSTPCSRSALDQPRVDVGVDARRDAAGDHADRRALGEVEQLLDEAVDLLGRRPRGRAR